MNCLLLFYFITEHTLTAIAIDHVFFMFGAGSRN